MRLCLFEDPGVVNLEPLTLTRPAFDLLCGLTCLASKQMRHFGPAEVGIWIRPALVDLCRLRQPTTPINDRGWLEAGPVLLVNARWLRPREDSPVPTSPGVALIGEELAYAFVEPEQLTVWSSHTLDDCRDAWKRTLPTQPAGVRLWR